MRRGVKLFFGLWSILSVAQITNSPQPQISPTTPLSPEVASLGKYIDLPVSMYTGTANINIPIYNIKSGGIELPIYLSYHSSGIRVSEIASQVGLGWNLNMGGIVSRVPKGFMTISRKVI